MFQSDSVAASTLTIEERKPDSSVHTIYGRDIEENDLSRISRGLGRRETVMIRKDYMQEQIEKAAEDIKRDIAAYRAAFRLVPEGKRRQGVPVGTWAHVRQYLNYRIARLETARMLCDWFVRGAQPSWMGWEQVEEYLQ